jgi:hypothetical protein
MRWVRGGAVVLVSATSLVVVPSGVAATTRVARPSAAVLSASSQVNAH